MSALGNLALIAAERGDLYAAERQWIEVLALEAALRPGTLQEARVLINAGRVAYMAGDMQTAAQRYERSAAILARISKDASLASYLYANWAELEADLGHVESAEAKFREALRINALQDRDCYCSGPTLRDHAVFLSERGRYQEAMTQLQTARGVLDGFDNGTVEGWSIDVQQAEMLRRAGRAVEADALIVPALAALQQRVPGAPLVAQALYTQGLIADELGRAQAARRAYCEAADVLDQIDLARAPDGLAAARFRSRHAEVYRACLDSTAKTEDAAAVFAEFERARARGLALRLQQRRLDVAEEGVALAR